MTDALDILTKQSNLESVVNAEANLPALNIFEQGISWRHLLESYYVSQRFRLNKSGATIEGIENLYSQYSSKNLLITSPAGFGKTTALKYLFLKYGSMESNRVYFISASSFVLGRNKLSNYQKAIRSAIEKNIAIGGLILIDGLEEAFTSNYTKASELIQKAALSHNNVWIACRNEYLARLKETMNSCKFNLRIVEKDLNPCCDYTNVVLSRFNVINRYIGLNAIILIPLKKVFIRRLFKWQLHTKSFGTF